MKRYAVIWCVDAPGADGLQQSMISAFGRDTECWEILRPDRPDFMDRAFGYAGYLISGSPKSVIDDADSLLVQNLLAFLRANAERGGAPVIGLCFGSQAIAAALGGRVERNPSGQFRLGVDRLDWSEEARPLTGRETGAAPTVLVQSHGESVTELPAGSVLLASSTASRHEVFLVRERFLGIQGHPEVDNAFLQQTFMAYHRDLFDDAQWARVQHESQQPLHPDRVIALGRQLLDEGHLRPAAAGARH